MKILIITQYFYPETFKSTDLAFELQKRGHDVTVLTGIPNYPEGEIYKDYGYFKNRKQTINGVKIIRSLLLPRGKGGGIRLFLNYYSFAFFASIKAFFLTLNNKYDSVIVHEPSPITQFYPALVVKFMQKTPIYFWVMDLWPESLEIAGGVNNKYVLGYYSKVIKNFYNHSTKILITSKGFKKSIEEKGNFGSKIEYFPNWAEESISNGNDSYPIPELPEGFKIVFAGNIGEAQDMDTIMSAANNLKGTDVKIILIGEGRKMPYVKEYITTHHLQNVVYTIGRYPVEAMASFFSKADLLLVSLKDDPIFNLTVPAKVQAYMSSGRPILAMLNGEGADTINEANCGFTVPASNIEMLSKTMIKVSQMEKHTLSELGENGKNYFLNHFTLENCINNLENILKSKCK